MVKKNKSKIVMFGVVILLIIVSKCYYSINYNNETDKKIHKNNEVNYVKENDDLIDEIDYIYDNKINEILDDMSLEEKVGQLFIVTLEDMNNSKLCTEYNETLENNLIKYNVGGIIFFKQNLINRQQTINLIKSIQEDKKIPLFISVDEEGGIVSRIADIPEMGTTKFEDMIEIGNKNDYDRAYEVGNTIGKEIHELGFNLDFAPVADVLTNNNFEIGTRSFGSDPNLVSKMVCNYIEGLQTSKVSATLKHFPGMGDSEENSHNESSYTYRGIEELKSTEFVPFKAGIEKGVDFLMVSHISVPSLTGSNEPSSLSEKVVSEIIRSELNYNNIIITDALNMGAISLNYSPEEAAIKAINAGVDIMLMSPDFINVYNKVIDSVKSGDISEERINESVYRILNIKMKRGIIFNK